MKHPFRKTISAIPKDSIVYRYHFGNILIIVLMAFLLFFSLIYHTYVKTRYEQHLTDLTALNELFTRVENATSSLTEYHSYLVESSRESCYQELSDVGAQALLIQNTMGKTYNRNLLDLFYTIETYLSEARDLLELLHNYADMGISAVDTYPTIETSYGEVIELTSYINSLFETIYQEQLEAVNAMETRMNRISFLFNICLLLFSAVVICICFTIFQDTNRFSKALIQVTEFSSNAFTPQGITQARMKVNGPWEISILSSTLNHMLDMIHEHMEQQAESNRIRQQLQESKLENLRVNSTLQATQYHLLQSRINPHFLFNTLNIISQTAYLEQAPEAIKIIEALSNLLRYNLTQSSEATTFRQELKCIQDYFFIQRCRYGERILFQINCEDDCLDASIPTMILQPLVENAIQHGAGKRIYDALIQIHIFQQNNRIHLCVFDNGIEDISLGRIQEIYRRLEEPIAFNEQHMGLKNTYYRIKLFFKEEIRFDITHTKDGSTISFSFPYIIQNTAD